MTYGHNVETMTLYTTVSSDTIVAFVIPLVALQISSPRDAA
jgi:hypothetical protein